MSTKPDVVPRRGTELQRAQAEAFGVIRVGVIHSTDDEERLFLHNKIIAPVWQGDVANEAAMLALISTAARGVWPDDKCYRVDTGTIWLCISGHGETLADWIEFPRSGAVSGSITGSGYTMSTARLLGRSTASMGAIEEISIGSGLSLTSGVLSATGGAGTVTSVSLTAPSFLSVGGSPVTGSGTLALSLANQTANLVFAGPATGSPAAPTFRALAIADLPATGTPTSSNYLRGDGTWSTPPGGGSGTVGSGTATQLAFYSATGTAVSSTPAFTIGVSGNPSILAQGTNQDVLLAPSGTGAVRIYRAAANTFANIEVDSATYGAAFGCWQNISGARTYGNFFSTEAATSDGTLSSRKNNVDTFIFRLINTDSSLLFPVATDATSSAAAAVKVSGGLAVAKTLWAGSIRVDNTSANAGIRYGTAFIYDTSVGLNVKYGENVFNPGNAGDKYIVNGGAACTQLIADNIYFRIAASGTANGAITWQEAITCVSGNRTLIGNPTDDSTTRLQINGAIKTSAPSGGTAGAWKFGIVVTAASTHDSTRYAQIDIGGTAYKVCLAT